MIMKANIDKERARKIYNYYSQIETTEGIIAELEEFIRKYNEGQPPAVIDENYQLYGSIQICIPYFEAGRFKNGSARVFNISYPAALKVLKSHIRTIKRMLKKELETIGEEMDGSGEDNVRKD